MRLIANISGDLTGAGYSAIVVTLARTLDLKGYIEILSDGRAFIIAEGEKEDLEIFAGAICIDNEKIRVKEILADYREPTGEFYNFYVISSSYDEAKGMPNEASVASTGHFPMAADKMERPERELCNPRHDLIKLDLDLEQLEQPIEPLRDEELAAEGCRLQREMRAKLPLNK